MSLPASESLVPEATVRMPRTGGSVVHGVGGVDWLWSGAGGADGGAAGGHATDGRRPGVWGPAPITSECDQ